MTQLTLQEISKSSQTGINSQWDDKLVYQIHHYGPASGTYGREQITNKLGIPLFIGEYGESDESNLRAITDWAQQTLEGYFPWSFKKMSHDRTLWTIPPNDAYNQVKAYINNGGSPPTHLYDAIISFAQNNVRNGDSSHEWHQGFYNAIKPLITCSEATSFLVPGQIQAENYCGHQGVQLETTTDSGGGQNIGFLDNGDYTEYNIDVSSSGLYRLDARVASQYSSGQMDVQINGASLGILSIPNTGGWQSFTTISTTLSLATGTHRLRLEFPVGNFNLNWISFSTVSGNAPTQSPTDLPQTGCTAATAFVLPGLIQAEEYCDEYGVQLETTTDSGGGQNIGFLDTNDYTEYNIDVSSSDQYKLEARVASEWLTGEMQVKVDAALLASFSIPNTGGWQSFTTISTTVSLATGTHRLRLEFPNGGFNLNWISFSLVPGNSPTKSPTLSPTFSPTVPPTYLPTAASTPTISPTKAPSVSPTSSSPTKSPTPRPTSLPVQPTSNPPAVDCTSASSFAVPGYLDADQYCDQRGLSLEATSDVGGGNDIVQIDNADYVEYNINVATSSMYTFAARVESGVYSGQINLQTNNMSALWLSVPHTNGAYKTIWANVWLNAGTHRLRVAFPQGGFKVHLFGFASGSNNPPQLPPISSTPPPTRNPTTTPTRAPISTTSAPTNLPTTLAPTKAPSRPPTNAPTTKAPTKTPTIAPTIAPTTKAPTDAPTTKVPTVAPITAAPSKGTAKPTNAPSSSPTQCTSSNDCNDFNECTFNVCTGGSICVYQDGACESMGKVCNGNGQCVDPPTMSPTPLPTSLPVQPTSGPPAVDCTSASSFAVPGFFQAEQYCDQFFIVVLV